MCIVMILRKVFSLCAALLRFVMIARDVLPMIDFPVVWRCGWAWSLTTAHLIVDQTVLPGGTKWQILNVLFFVHMAEEENEEQAEGCVRGRSRWCLEEPNPHACAPLSQAS